MKATDIRVAFNLPPERAIAFLGAKGLVTSGGWQEVWQEAHARAFTVANCAKLDVLQDIHDALMDAQKNGTTFAQFQDRLTPLLQKKGWWGKAIDPATGEVTATYPNSLRPVQYGSPRRLKTIFDTNIRTSYMAGKFNAFTESADTHPFWMYTAVLDNHTRPRHRALHGRVFSADDPIWRYIWPPNGFGCRCTVINMRKSTMEAQGYKLSDSREFTHQVEVPISKRDPSKGTTKVTRIKLPGMDKSFQTDPGWNTNQAMAAYQPKLDSYDYQVARQYIRGTIKGPDFQRFFAGKSQEDFPVAVLKPSDVAAIGALSQTVYLSQTSLAEHLAKHPEIGLEDYQKIPDILDRGAVYKQGEDRLVVLQLDGVLYRAGLKRTKSGLKNYFLTLYRTNDKAAERSVTSKFERLR
ncbi:SPP1 gp7 family putative phage head morphogenesis protein [Duganella sp. SG902]|uniref:phage head morphogenesis protein n=1 Tax=Duganella sp. SG902 TaxID=2587016 RepID=UPI00159D1D93|nr:phage minor head protein [Duganella sp. SG902]NVM78894.1 SPP1 gp7 family putative phage head morphogenesis protein [Duganella sp. SG902]